ncbi:hypothetical protein NM688_g735 [Phlebia brevispora]|uniref:Uncharacterized protein n=1 Tax=Phlebia brevispora TaxID=194682 RepID=A0ACC1TDL7_9APHY|nr:hypothetical protein NM688_g735 [Phlebia brevispora]
MSSTVRSRASRWLVSRAPGNLAMTDSFLNAVASWRLSFRQCRTPSRISKLLSRPNGASVSGTQSHFTWILANESSLLTYFTVVLSVVAALQSAVAVVQSDLPTLLTHESVVQSGVSSLFSNSGSDVTVFAEILTYFPNLTHLAEILTDFAYVFPGFSCLLTCITCVQSYLAAMVALEPLAAAAERNAERNKQSRTFLQHLALVGLNLSLLILAARSALLISFAL